MKTSFLLSVTRFLNWYSVENQSLFLSSDTLVYGETIIDINAMGCVVVQNKKSELQVLLWAILAGGSYVLFGCLYSVVAWYLRDQPSAVQGTVGFASLFGAVGLLRLWRRKGEQFEIIVFGKGDGVQCRIGVRGFFAARIMGFAISGL